MHEINLEVPCTELDPPYTLENVGILSTTTFRTDPVDYQGKQMTKTIENLVLRHSSFSIYSY